MTVIRKRNLTLLVVRLMVVWVYLDLVIYMVMPRDAYLWLRMNSYGSGMGGSLLPVFALASITAISWFFFGIWVWKSSGKIAERIVPIDGETGSDSENTPGDVLRLVIFCVGVVIACRNMDSVPGPLRLFLVKGYGFYGGGKFFPGVLLVSLFLVFKPNTVARWTRAFPETEQSKKPLEGV